MNKIYLSRVLESRGSINIKPTRYKRSLNENKETTLYHFAYLSDLCDILKSGYLRASTNHYADMVDKNHPLDRINKGKKGVSFTRNPFINVRGDIAAVFVTSREELHRNNISIKPVVSPKVPYKSNAHYQKNIAEEVAFSNVPTEAIEFVIIPSADEIEWLFEEADKYVTTLLEKFSSAEEFENALSKFSDKVNIVRPKEIDLEKWLIGYSNWSDSYTKSPKVRELLV